MAEEQHTEREESLVNRWLVDHYISLALQLFDDDQYQSFCEVRQVIQSKCQLTRSVLLRGRQTQL